MNKSELIKEISASGAGNASTAQIDAILTKAFSVMEDKLSGGEEVNLPGFGKFTVTDRPEREGRNPATGEAMTIKASKAVKFKAAGQLKNSLAS